MRGNMSLEYEKAINYIYGLMKDGTLREGSRLPAERTISEEVGIGRNSTREALSILQGMGLIESVRGSGNYVTRKSGQSMKQTIKMMLALGSVSEDDVCVFRREMEKSVCSLLMNKTLPQAHKQEMEYLLHKMKHLRGKRLADADKAFHDLLIQATGNGLWIIIMEAVTEVYSELIDRVVRNSDEDGQNRLRRCHEDIFFGLIEKDTEKMMRAIEEHYDMIEELLNV